MPGENGNNGDVDRMIVVRVASAVAESCGYSFADDEEKNTATFVKDSVPEVYQLSAKVRRKQLHRLSHKYGINIEYFYHPEMCCGPSATEK